MLLGKVEEQIAKEAKERQAENMRRNQKQNTQKSPNLDDSEKARTDEIMAKKAGKCTLYKHRSHARRTQTELPYK